MRNEDFRRFVLDTPRKSQDASPGSIAKPSGPASSLGSRSKFSIPMTPRTVKGGPSVDFARQLAEHNAGSHPTKKFRSSAAPKGVRLGEGYTDRALHRTGEGDDGEAVARDEREARVLALEEQMKLGQIDRETFEQLRDSITGGDIGATHLVKGLDRRLLERVRKGEDVLRTGVADNDSLKGDTTTQSDAEEELEALERKELAPVEHEKAEKRGEMAAPPKPLAGTKRSRNDILAELKASRKAAQEQKATLQPQLGSKFKKLGEQKSTEPRIERDEKGREVLITVDENGRVKRKVRKVAVEDKPVPEGLLMPDKKAKPLGMAVPDPMPTASKQITDEDEDIFEGVGDSYDPLEAINGGDSASSEDEDDDENAESDDASAPFENALATSGSDKTSPLKLDESKAQLPAAQPTESKPTKHNYFNDTPSSSHEPTNGLNDPAILETIKRAAALRPESISKDAPSDDHLAGAPVSQSNSSVAHRLMQPDRDLDDIDMGFGSSRFGDEEEDGEGSARVKLSEWRGGLGGDDDDDAQEGSRGGQKQRKRGKKKKKGDKDSAADVLRVIEGRKK